MGGSFGNPFSFLGVGAGSNGQHWQTNQALYSDPLAAALAQQARYDPADAIAAAFPQAIAARQAAAEGIAQCPEPENEGIKMGEVIAWRAWSIHEGWLYSILADKTEWAPGQTMKAHRVGVLAGDGIHAFKTRKAAIQEYGNGLYRVIGQVALWGEIIEYEDGYHAEFAKIHSLDWMKSPENKPPFLASLFRLQSPANRLEELQNRYGVSCARS